MLGGIARVSASRRAQQSAERRADRGI